MIDRNILFARQPIFDAKKDIVAFELLYRANENGDAEHDDGDAATSQVLINAFTDMAIEDVVGDKLAFINFTPHLLVNPPPFDPDKLVIEVLENITLSEPLRNSIEQLKTKGYRIALDDFRQDLSIDELVEIADIVKLDVLDLAPEELLEHLNYLRDYPVRLLAEKIETYEMYDHCVDLGFEMFQGFFLSRPQLVKGTRIAENQQILMRLLQRVSDTDSDVEELAKTIAADPVLSYKLLRLVNSAMYQPVDPIESLQHAISYLGIRNTRNWALLIALSKLGGKPVALALTSLVRARFCEVLAGQCEGAEPERCFTVGLLSMLDAYFDLPLAEALQTLKLSEALTGEILLQQGTAGLLLETVKLFELADWDAVDWPRLATFGIDKPAAESAYLSALKWSDELVSIFSDSNATAAA